MVLFKSLFVFGFVYAQVYGQPQKTVQTGSQAGAPTWGTQPQKPLWDPATHPNTAAWNQPPSTGMDTNNVMARVSPPSSQSTNPFESMLRFMMLQRLFAGATGADAPDPAPARPMDQFSRFLRLQAMTRRFNNQMRLERQRQSRQSSYQNVYPNDNQLIGRTQTKEGPPPRSIRTQKPRRVSSKPPPSSPGKTVTKSGSRPVKGTHPEVLQTATGKSAPNQGQAAEPVEVEQAQAQGASGGNAQTGNGPTPAKAPQGAGQAAQTGSTNNQGQAAEPAEIEGRAQRRKSSTDPGFGPPPSESPATWPKNKFASWPQDQIGTGSTGQFQQQSPTDQYTPQDQFGTGSPRKYQQQQTQGPYISRPQSQFGQAPAGQRPYDYPPQEQSIPPSQNPYSPRLRNQAGGYPNIPASQNQYVPSGKQYPQSPTYPKGNGSRRRGQGGKFDAWLQRQRRLGGRRRPGAATNSGAEADRQADRADMMSDYMDNLQAMATEPPPPTPQANPLMWGVGMPAMMGFRFR